MVPAENISQAAECCYLSQVRRLTSKTSQLVLIFEGFALVKLKKLNITIKLIFVQLAEVVSEHGVLRTANW